MYTEFISIKKHILIDYFNFISKNYHNIDIKTFAGLLDSNENKLKKIYLSEEEVRTATISESNNIRIKQSFLHKLYDSYKVFINGEKIFRINENLALQLVNTELKAVPAKLIKCPYDAIEIEVPENLFVFFENEENESKITSICVDLKMLDNNKTFLRISFYIYNTKLFRQEHCYGYDFEFGNEEEVDIQQELINKAKESLLYNKLLENKEVFNTTKLSIIFALNVLLYISNPDIKVTYHRNGEEKLKKLQGKERQRFKKILQERIAVGEIGGEIILSREEKDLYIRHAREGVPLTVKVLVMGHWRRQWYGNVKSDERQRMVIWIRPYWKGFENEIISNKVHVLQHHNVPSREEVINQMRFDLNVGNLK